MTLCRREQLSIVRGEVGSAEERSSALPQAISTKFKPLRDYGAAVAQGTHNPLVVGSNPSGPIKKDFRFSGVFFVSL